MAPLHSRATTQVLTLLRIILEALQVLTLLRIVLEALQLHHTTGAGMPSRQAALLWRPYTAVPHMKPSVFDIPIGFAAGASHY
eukprot:gene10858-16972_t